MSIANARSRRPGGASPAVPARRPSRGRAVDGRGRPTGPRARRGRSRRVNVTVAPGSIWGVRKYAAASLRSGRGRVDPAGGAARPAARHSCTVRVTFRPAARRRQRRRPSPGTARPRLTRAGPRSRAPTIATPTARNDRAVDLRAARVGQPERVAALAQPDVDSATGRPQRTQAWVGSGGQRSGRRRSSARSMVPRIAVGPRPASGPAPYQRAGGVDERVDVLGRAGGDDRAVGAGLAASAATSRAGRGPTPVPASRPSSSQSSPWKPDDDALVGAPPAGRLERLEVERQVLLEVVVERATSRRRSGPPSAGTGRRLAADDDPRRRVGDRDGRRRRRAGRTATAGSPDRRSTGPAGRPPPPRAGRPAPAASGNGMP